VKPRKKRQQQQLQLQQQPRQRRRQQRRQKEQADAAALKEALELAETVQVPLIEAVKLLMDDREDYVPPAALVPPPGAGADADGTSETPEDGSLLTKSTIEAYVSAVIELWRIQVAHGHPNKENPRGAAVRGFIDQRGRMRNKLDRAEFKDRGSDGIQAGYSPEQWLRMQDLLLKGTAVAPQNLRTRIDLLLGHYYLLRGENRRKMELADLSLFDYPSSEGPSQCGCLVSLLRNGKMNKTAKKEFMGALRHKDPLLCTQGALAQLLFWRWHVVGEKLLWYMIVLLWKRICYVHMGAAR
jgi:Centromere DNA-binding protein complex CBF3 subunit, domain 2